MSEPGVYTSPAGVVTPDNRSGVILIVNIIGLVIAISSVAVRAYITSAGLKKLVCNKDDTFCLLATIFCIAESALIFSEVSKGFSKSIDLISLENLIQVQKFAYAIDITYIVGIYCTKLSILFLLMRLHGPYSNLVLRTGLILTIIAGITSVFVIALKCNPHHPWIQYSAQCQGLLARWQFVEITSILVEAGLFLSLVYLAANVQMEFTAKIKMVLLFGTRLFIIAFAVLRILRLPNYLSSTNPTLDGTSAAIWAQIELHYSLITTTTPLIKQFVLQFHTNYGALQSSTIATSRVYGGSVRTNSTHPRQEVTTDVGAKIGEPRSEKEPWTERPDCAHARTTVTANDSINEEPLEEENRVWVHRKIEVRVTSKDPLRTTAAP
ncbi:uncharacterized protein K441DRAFT_282203 [Cenococcum geophilum 1.58]|uniref:uncharacterized protein n=1 Tax=Cenococcum geophilum 1.58 TaxID=794803 RepID=UPI00358FDC3E|nr:hypothetical protein K441DRAFT_282203 [Cenococcum geophilum 1.58]